MYIGGGMWGNPGLKNGLFSHYRSKGKGVFLGLGKANITGG